MSKVNLLEETMRMLRKYRKGPSDVVFVTDGDVSVFWRKFAAQAAAFYYDNGYGIQMINANLKVVGADWWLERFEYDGAEWWVFKTRPRHTSKPGTLQLLDYKEYEE